MADDHNHSEEECDWLILKLANEKGKFGLELNLPMCEHLVAAFERGIDHDWFTLVDISFVGSAKTAMPLRIFKLTTFGQARRAVLEKKFNRAATH